MSGERRRDRSEAFHRALEEIAEITDETDTDEAWADVFLRLDAAGHECPTTEGKP